MEARARQVPLVVVRRDDRALLLEQRAVAHRAVADADRARARPTGRRARARAARRRRARTPRAAARRSTGTAPGAPAASASSVETPAPRRSSASASPRAAASPMRTPVKLPGPIPTASASRSRGMRAALAQQRVDVLEQRLRARHALAEHLAVVDERARRHLRRRVERQRQHSSIETTLRAPSACRIRTAKRGGGSTPAPASGHSTNAIASSKYGSRSPHSAAETPVEAVEVEVRDLACRARGSGARSCTSGSSRARGRRAPRRRRGRTSSCRLPSSPRHGDDVARARAAPASSRGQRLGLLGRCRPVSATRRSVEFRACLHI